MTSIITFIEIISVKKNQGMQDSKNVLGILINFTDCQS